MKDHVSLALLMFYNGWYIYALILSMYATQVANLTARGLEVCHIVGDDDDVEVKNVSSKLITW